MNKINPYITPQGELNFAKFKDAITETSNKNTTFYNNNISAAIYAQMSPDSLELANKQTNTKNLLTLFEKKHAEEVVKDISNLFNDPKALEVAKESFFKRLMYICKKF